jgi:membrane protein implicated in regulation of membrane protease activity
MEGITPYVWLIAGVLLMLVEFMAPVMIAFFFGISAVLVGVLLFAGVDLSAAQQLITFSLMSIASLVVGRKYCKSWFKGNLSDNEASDVSNFKQDVGEYVTVTSEFVNGTGRVKLNGVEWSAKLENENEEGVEVGATLEIVKNKGIELIVRSRKHS